MFRRNVGEAYIPAAKKASASNVKRQERKKF